jgi:serine/threonine-protein kinase
VVEDLFDDVPDPLIGRTLDRRYEVLGRLGEGGAGVVYRGRQTQLGRLVAIKVLHEDREASSEWRRRFEREARALSALAHPNIVPVTDSGIDRGVPFLVMELLDGKTLKDLIKEGPLPLWRALDVARQTLRGLAFAHGKGIVHRDLKPANVFLQALPDQADHVRLLDFGMVKFLEGSSSRTMTELTRVGARIGTPAYMSPEQVNGAPADARTDVYAAGVLLFELLTGRRPFVADSREGYMAAHLTEPVPSLAKVQPGLARARMFQAVIARAMAKKPAERFEDAEAMLAALEDVVARLPAAALSRGRPEARRRSAPHATSAPPSGSQFWRGAVLVFACAAGIAAVRSYVRREQAKPPQTPAPPAQPAPQPPLPPPTPAQSSPAPSPPPSPPSPAPAPPPAPPAEQPPTAALPSPPPTPPPPSLPSPKPEPPTSPPTELRAPAQDQEAAPSDIEGKAAGVARDPWREPVPRALRSIRDRVARGARLSQRALTPAYEFAHQNPGDPRPWLLLGRAYAQLDWLSDSMDRYLRAYHVDSTCRGDPQMLADLLRAAAHPVAGRGAARAIRDIYGAEAIPAVEQDLERRAGEPDVAARLARLRESLSH